MIIEHTNCTHHIKTLFTVGKNPVYAGAEVDWEYFTEENPSTIHTTLNLRGYAVKPKNIIDKVLVQGVEVKNHVLMKENCPQITPEVIVFDWPDGGVSVAGKSFWHALNEYLRDVKGGIFVHCQGGHGRTGTALAILAVLNGAVPEDTDPVEWVRAQYCSCAVETQAQINYIEKITGRTVKAVPRPYHTRASGYYSTAGGYNRQWDHHPPMPPLPQTTQPVQGTTASATRLTKKEWKQVYRTALKELKEIYHKASAQSVDTVIELICDDRLYWKQVPKDGYFNSCGCFLGTNHDDARQLSERLTDLMCEYIKEHDYGNDTPATT